jgi:uncharacterized protein YbjT (DUF2867 family)
MSLMGLKVILFGSTGMVGGGVLLKSIVHPDVEKILIINRRSCGIVHSKVREIIHKDFFDYSNIINELGGYDACFFCLGVSSIGMNENDYKRMTYELTLQAAKSLSAVNKEMIFCYVSGAGTDSTEKGKLMWARVKGKTENDLTKLPFKSVYAFRPGFIKPVDRQKNIKTIFTVVGFMYPLLKMIYPNGGCKLDEIAFAMINAIKFGFEKRILENNDIEQLAKKN